MGAIGPEARGEDDFLSIGGIQHFVFCRRQWALIHIEMQWEDNLRTVEGELMHERAHDPSESERRGDVIISRAMRVCSREFGIAGECDVVEFHRDPNGVSIVGREGRFSVFPVEYKRGSPKPGQADLMQLTAQALCLEEMLCCTVPLGYIYYGETRHRLRIDIDDGLRAKTKDVLEEMRRYYRLGHTPRVKWSKSCNACSMRDVCLPALGKNKSAGQFIELKLSEEDDG